MLRLAGKAPCRFRPVNSALGLAFNMARSHKWSLVMSQMPAVARFGHAHGQPSSSQRCGPGLNRTNWLRQGAWRGAPRLPTTSAGSTSVRIVVVGASRRRAAPRNQFRGRAALGGPGMLRQRRAGGAEHSSCHASTICAQAGLRRFGAVRRRPTVRCMPPARPNRSFKGTRNSKAARPRGAQVYHAPHGRAALLPRAP